MATSVITIGELRAGVLAADSLERRDRRLATVTAALALDVPVVTHDDDFPDLDVLEVVRV